MKIKRYFSFVNENYDDNNKEAWWDKNYQRLIDYTGNPAALEWVKETDPEAAEEWGEMDEEERARLMLTLFDLRELEETLLEFEDIDD